MKLLRRKSNSSSFDSLPVSSVSGHSSSAEEVVLQDGSSNQNPIRGNSSSCSLSTRNLNAAISDSTSWRIQRSWKLLTSKKHRLEKVGVEFFCRMFEHNPELLQLFHFGSHELERDQYGNRILPPALKSHALTVMQFLGKFVSGLTCLEQAIPQVRAIGKLHVRVGVEPHHYDILFKHLIETIADELGPLSFDMATKKGETWSLSVWMVKMMNGL
jgi:hemoglobin-like flavoprotein